MNKKFSILTLVILSAILFLACKKTKNGPVISAQEQVLINRVWQLQSLTIPKASDPSIDSSITQSCSDSALLAFNSNKMFQFADASKEGCDSSVVPYDQGNWSLTSDGDSLFLKGKRNFVWKIEKLNDTIIKATFRDSLSPEINSLKTIILK